MKFGLTEILAIVGLLPGWAAFAWTIWQEVEKRKAGAANAITLKAARQDETSAHVVLNFHKGEAHAAYDVRVSPENFWGARIATCRKEWIPGGLGNRTRIVALDEGEHSRVLPMKDSDIALGDRVAEFLIVNIPPGEKRLVIEARVTDRATRKQRASRLFYVPLD